MRRFLLTCLPLLSWALTGCTNTEQRPARENRFVVFFSATRTADHAPILSATVPVTVGGEGSVKTNSKVPVQDRPALPEFLVRLKNTRQAGVYEMVTQVSVRELKPAKKGKLKVGKRFVGALVPTRVGETELVSPEGDSIRLEARLERR